ncbi:MAG: 2OG-Fe(II) oxygenase [Planctomycetota bacterium]
MPTDFIEIYDHALRPELCREAIARFEARERKSDGLTGHGVDKSKKNSTDLTITGLAQWSDLHGEILDSTLRHLMQYLRKYPYLMTSALALSVQDTVTGQIRPLAAADVETAAEEHLGAYLFKVFRPGAINVQKYSKNVGGYYYWHSEIYPRDPAAETLHRVLLFMFYLNDVDEGGETEFLYQERKLKPTAGTMVIAPAGFTHTHRGNVPRSNDKYILTSWILFNRAEQIYDRKPTPA